MPVSTLAEQKAVAATERSNAALTPANYEFLGILHQPDHLMRVEVKPRRKQLTLIHGSLFLNANSADLVRVEGEPSQRPSFWTRRVHIVREYSRIGGVHVPVEMSSTADVLMVGASTFSMRLSYMEIKGRLVTSDAELSKPAEAAR